MDFLEQAYCEQRRHRPLAPHVDAQAPPLSARCRVVAAGSVRYLVAASVALKCSPPPPPAPTPYLPLSLFHLFSRF